MIRDDLVAALRDALAALGVEAPADIGLEVPSRREHGDWSSNVALATAKAATRNPRELATQIVERLNAHPPAHVEKVDVAGPGFVNFHLRESWLHAVLEEVVEQGEHGYARHDFGAGTRVNLEFVSANPTGPIHAGGGRWAAYGDALGAVMARCGYTVHREYYLNDRGAQMELFGRSLTAAKQGVEPPEGGYRGGYVDEWADEMPAVADPVAWGYERARRDIEESMRALGVEFDTWFSERSLVESGETDATLAELRERGYAYDSDGAVWLRSTDFGDDKDRPLVKSDGDITYILGDLAYHRSKFARGFELLIDVWGADHHGYVKRLHAGMQALGHDPAEIEIVIGQLVTILKGGEPVRLSKRAGDLVLIADLSEAVGRDVARLAFLLQGIDTPQRIDLDELLEQSMENPVFYVQYAHARIASMARFAQEQGVTRQPLADVDLSPLIHEREIELLRTLSELPDIVATACRDRAPHKVTTWVRELAGRFHGFYHDCYVIGRDVPPALTQARLWLVEAARIGFSIGLDLLGVHAPDQM